MLPAVPAHERGEADDETDAPHSQDHQLGPAQKWQVLCSHEKWKAELLNISVPDPDP